MRLKSVAQCMRFSSNYTHLQMPVFINVWRDWYTKVTY